MPGTSPVNQRMFNIQGERREAWLKLCDKLIQEKKWEHAISPWSSPSFPVAKKEPGSYRLVVDFRAVNEATIADSYPLPLINDVLQKHGKFTIHSAFDIKDVFHQVPLKKEHRYITAMSTPRGKKQWKVIVMGLKNSGAQFQRESWKRSWKGLIAHMFTSMIFWSVVQDRPRKKSSPIMTGT